MQWIRGASWLSGGSVVSLGATAAAGILVARFLNPAGFGLYAAISVATTVVATLSVYGLDLHLVTVLQTDDGDRQTYAAVLRAAFGLALLLALAGEIVTWVAFSHRVRLPLMIDLGEVAFAPLLLRQVLLQVRGQQRQMVVALMVNRATWIVAVLLIVSFRPSDPLPWLMGARVAVLCVQGGVLAALARFPLRRSHRPHGRRRHRYRRRLGSSMEILRASTPIALTTMFGTSYMRLDQLLLTALRGSYATGLYAGGVRLAEVPSTIPAIIQNVSLPTLIKVQRSKQVAELSRALNDALLFTLIPGGLGVALIAGLGRPLVVLTLGPRFAGAATVVIILAAADWARLPTSVFTSLALAVGRRRVLVIGTAVAVAVNIVVNVTLIPFLGAPAAALASLLSYATSAFLIARGALRRGGFSELSYSLPVRLGMATLFAGLLGHVGLITNLTLPAIVVVALDGSLITIGYLLAVFLVIPNNERHRLLVPVRRALTLRHHRPPDQLAGYVLPVPGNKVDV